MTIRISTGLRNGMLGDVGFQTALANGVLRFYSGAQPASADSAIAGTFLGQLTIGGGAFSHGSPTNGLNWDTPAAGAISKPSGDVWSGLATVAGTAGWARFSGNPADTGASSTTLSRVDFSVGKNSGDIRLNNINLEVNDPLVVSSAQMTLPATM